MYFKNQNPNYQYYMIGADGLSLETRSAMNISDDGDTKTVTYDDLSISIINESEEPVKESYNSFITLRYELSEDIYIDIVGCNSGDKIIIDKTVYPSLDELVPAGVSVLGKLSMPENKYIKYALGSDSHYYCLEHLKVSYRIMKNEDDAISETKVTNMLKVSKVLCQ